MKWIGEKYTCHETNQEKNKLSLSSFHVIIQDAIFIYHFDGIVRSLSLFIGGRTSTRVRSSTRISPRRRSMIVFLRTRFRVWLRTWQRTRLSMRLRTRLWTGLRARLRTKRSGPGPRIWLRLRTRLRLRYRIRFCLRLWFDRRSNNFWRSMDSEVVFEKLSSYCFLILV